MRCNKINPFNNTNKGRIIAGVESSTAKHIPIVNQPSPSLVLINNPTDTTPLVTTVTTPATPLTTSDNMELPKLDGPSTPLVSIHDQIAVNIPPVDVDFDNSHASDIPEELKPFIPEGPLLSTDSKLSNKQHRLKQKSIRLARQHQAKWLGTSLNKLEERQGLTNDLTKFHDIYHTRMTSFTNKRKKIKDPAKLAKLESAYEEFVSEFSFSTFINPNLTSISL
ncbi:uncharacterized protein OCT59_023456 [Rhizophagus irregularis]|uniref:uncharacterized protein n=1 Tax=Rhizophagus irregularis TaxID=588596 RepID=UPI00332239FE|nr:hypothetical protein OCT59_023456 [Rhizophagus irregularis]